MMSLFPVVTATDADWGSLFGFVAHNGQLQLNLPAALELLNDFLADSAGRQQLLPYLSLIVTVLGTHTRNEDLLEFLYQCCSRLEHSPDAGQHFAVFFRYLLAFVLEDDAMMAHYGHRLDPTALANTLPGDASHSSVVSSKNFHIWHRMHTNASIPSVLQAELLACISEAEQATGPTDLCAVNSLALLGRLLQEQTHYSRAAEVLKDAITRLHSCSRIFQAYKLDIVQRLAIVEKSAGYPARSGVLLLEVCVGRIQVLGIQHEYTAGALQLLRDHLNELEANEKQNAVHRRVKAAI